MDSGRSMWHTSGSAGQAIGSRIDPQRLVERVRGMGLQLSQSQFFSSPTWAGSGSGSRRSCTSAGRPVVDPRAVKGGSHATLPVEPAELRGASYPVGPAAVPSCLVVWANERDLGESGLTAVDLSSVPPNKEMQLTRPVQIVASQLISRVRRTIRRCDHGK